MATRVVDLGNVRGPQGEPGPGGRPNLLDNWCFADPINQRGKTSYTDHGAYTVDRWALYSPSGNGCSLQLLDGGVKLSHTSGEAQLLQHVDEYDIPIGAKVTYSALVDDELITGTVTMANDFYSPQTGGMVRTSDGKGMIRFRKAYGHTTLLLFVLGGASKVFRAAKLELGDSQTLATQDEAGNWVLNDPLPNKALELAKCQRYFVRLTGSSSECNAILGYQSANFATMWIPLPVTMRANPAYLIWADLTMDADPPSQGVTGTAQISTNGVFIRSPELGDPEGTSRLCMIGFYSASDYIDLSADL